jgi:hypothetical protein
MSGFMPLPGMFKEIVNAAVEISEDGIIFEDNYVARAIGAAEGLKATKSVAAMKVVNAFRQDVLSIPPLDSNGPPNVLATSAFYGHGSEDQKVACKLGNELVEIVKKLDMNIRYHQVYQGLGHWIQVLEETDDMISVFTQRGSWPHHVDGSAP